MRFYHGTDMPSALYLLAGGLLDPVVAEREHIDGDLGFYVATDADAAEFFAARRLRSALVAVDISDSALLSLEAAGAVRDSMPGTPPPYLPGGELHVPISAFSIWNKLRKEGEIIVRHP